ncbi:MAG TPA: nitrite/sulfite reductase, partial [Chromatiales bacterium]|nr:nitrite/sulfite reductase [Chromatiales bacterium]
IARHFEGTDKLREAGDLSLNISGCMNACGHHHVGNIGILGVDKRGKEFFQLTLGGASDQNPALGERLGRAMPREHVPAAIDAIVDSYLEHRLPGEHFNDTCHRIGLEVFRNAVYGPVTDARRSA